MATIDVALSGMTVSVALVQQVLPQVAAAFKPFGITLNFVAGTSFGSVDPVQAANFGTLTKQLLANSAQNVPPSPTYLVATQTPPGYTYSLNGSMLDYMRGIAAVYTNASICGSGGAASRLDILAQICIHELGHMLDSTHGDASGAYPNAMLPSSQRMVSGGPGPAWTAAAAEAHSYGEPAVPQPNPTNFYPLTRSAAPIFALHRTIPPGGPFSRRFVAPTRAARRFLTHADYDVGCAGADERNSAAGCALRYPVHQQRDQRGP